MLIFHACGIVALAPACGADLAQDAAAEDFDLGQILVGMKRIVLHGVDQVLFVAKIRMISQQPYINTDDGQSTHDSCTSRAKGKKC